MEFRKKILSNGLSIIGEINGSAKSGAVGFFVKTGARDESDEVSGVSHFLEHMVFKGTEELSALEVNESFDRTGASFNAFTSEESTVYYAAVLPEYLLRVTGLWCELMRARLGQEDFDIEKNVIKEEIAMYQDMPHFDVMDQCRSLYFGDHPCGKSVLGSVESIDGLRSEQMREYFSRRYSPNNIVFTVTGNADFDELAGEIKAKCGGWGRGDAGREVSDYSGNIQHGSKKKGNLSCEHICLMSRCVSAQSSKRFAASVLGCVIGDDVGSRYFWELVDPAIAETAAMQAGFMDGTGTFYSYFRCGVENVEKVMDRVGGIFGDLAENGVGEGELAKAKNKILSALVVKNERPMGRLIDVGFNWMYLGQYRSLQEDIDSIKAVSVEEVNGLLGELELGKFTRYSLGPARG